MSSLKDRIKGHEGLRLFPYKCPAGKWTIGYGRNLDALGISVEEASHMLDNDLLRCETDLNHYSWYHALDRVRQEAIIELRFNLGLMGLLGFKKMIAALNQGDYPLAADELLDSKWRSQVGATRSGDMAYRLRFGKYR